MTVPTDTQARGVGCAYFAGRDNMINRVGWCLHGPYKQYYTTTINNVDSERGIYSIFNYDLADAAYKDDADRTAFLIYTKLGASAASMTTGRNIHALDVLCEVNADYAVTTNLRNADVRGARIQVYGNNNVSGVLHGAYINCQLKGAYTYNGRYVELTSSYGGIGLEVRTEVTGAEGETVTCNDSLVNLFLIYKGSRALDGNLYMIAINKPWEGASGVMAVTGETVGIKFVNGNVLTTEVDFDIGIDFADDCVIAIDIGDCTTGISFTGTSIGRAIGIGAFGSSDNVLVTSTNNYPFGCFAKIAETEGDYTTSTLRAGWFRFRVDAGVEIGQSANWGHGINGLQATVKLYGGTTTKCYSWECAGIWAQLETDGTASVEFNDGCVAASVFANVGLTASASDNTIIKDGAVACGVAINSNSATNVGTDSTGIYAGLYIYKDNAALKNFASAILLASAFDIGIKIDADCTTGIDLTSNVSATDGILIAGANADGIHISGAQTANGINISGANVDGIEISGNNTAYGINITGTNTTAAIMIDGTNKLMFDDSAMYMYASADGHLEIVADDTLRLTCPGWGNIQFGGEPDWGGGGGFVVDGNGFDWCTGTVAAVASGALATSCAAAYHSMSVDVASHSTTSSFFGTWTELYIKKSLTGAANAAAVWGQVECSASVTGPDQSDGDYMAAGYFNFITGTDFTTGSYVNGVRIQSEVSSTNYSLTGSTWMAGLEILRKSGSYQNWTYGVKIANADVGIDVGAATTGIQVSGVTTTGIYISGYAPTGIRVGGICNASIANLKSVYLETTVGASGVISGWIAGIHVETYVNSNATVPEHYGIIVQTYCDIGGNKDIFPIRLEHNGSSVANAFMNLQGSPRYLFNSSNTAEAWGNVTGSPADQAGWLKVKMGGNDRYILLYGTAP